MEMVIWYVLLLFSLNSELSMEGIVTTKGPLPYICTRIFPSSFKEVKPLNTQDEDAINELLGCKNSITNCEIQSSDTVICDCDLDKDSCRVTGIYFLGRGLEGELPEKIGNLQHLGKLVLNGNKFHGEIPPSYANLTKLTELYLYDNKLEGKIPPFLGNMKMLRSLDLSGNFFNGPIPSNLSSFKLLTYLDLSNNLLTQEIPIELGEIERLKSLRLGSNQLSGPLRDELGNLTHLEYLSLHSNEFVGGLPLRVMELMNLKYFNVRGNNLGGQIPHSIGHLQNLQYLNLMGNNFEAPLPREISNLTNLVSLHVSDLVGEHTADTQFPNISKMNSLRYLTLRNCSLADRIPPEIWNVTSLYYLDLSFNSLFGGIPTNVYSPPISIFLRKNKLNETIPSWIMNSTRYIDVSENLFTNNVTEISNLNSTATNLNFFSCLNSSGEGTYWEQVGYSCNRKGQLLDRLYINCGGESMLINGSNYEADLSSNGSATFFLSISSSWGYSSMGNHIASSGPDNYTRNSTCIVSTGDGALYSTARVSPISLKYYGFCLKNDVYTVKLHFAELVNYDYKPPYIRVGRLFDVDIQGKNVLKNFSIEKEAGGLNKGITKKFNNINVDNGRLEIHLYWSGKGSMIVPTNQYGPLVSAISVHPFRETGIPTRVLFGTSVSALLLLILLMAYFWNLEDKSKGLVELYPGGLYNFRKIKAATKNFKDKLGEGSFGAVYKALLKNGAVVAVEKVSATKDGIMRVSQERHPTIYLMEHPNLVKLMGCIAEKNQLLLVYEYMGNNTLQNALFGPDRPELNWPTRHKICLDIAEGLVFLHSHNPEIVHGSIKPSNIFLDDHHNAKISDFGFARLHDQGKSRLDGTVVYMAPEIFLDQLTTKADVYSFGVLLLVVISGEQAATSISSIGGDTKYLTDEATIMWRDGNLMNLVDTKVKEDKNYEQEEVETVLELAMLCLEKSSTIRPTMSQVVKVLKKGLKLKDLKESLKQPWYMGNNTLQNALFGPKRPKLDWPTRHKICLDIAEGLVFLHNKKTEIVHGSITPSNIFLDDHLNAKISDFGFARLHDQGKLREDGTVVYMAPEYEILDQSTTKADVYSFGVLLLVVVSGEQAATSLSSIGGDTKYLTEEAHVLWRNGNLMNLVDPKVKDENFEQKEAETILELAMLCLEKSSKMRPTMSQVLRVLKKELDLKDLKESSKQLEPSNCGTNPDPQCEIEDTSGHSKSRSSSKGGMTDISSISASPSSTV